MYHRTISLALGGEIVKYHARHRQIDRGREREKNSDGSLILL